MRWGRRPPTRASLATEPIATEVLAPYDVNVIEAFLSQARHLAEWYRVQGAGFETKAGLILGFSAAILGLFPLSIQPITRAFGSWQIVVVVTALAAAVATACAALCCVIVLWPRTYRYASRSQLESIWEEYKQAPSDRLSEGWSVLGTLTDQLVVGGASNESPLASLARDSQERGRWFLCACASIVAGAILAGVTGGTLLIEQVTS